MSDNDLTPQRNVGERITQHDIVTIATNISKER